MKIFIENTVIPVLTSIRRKRRFIESEDEEEVMPLTEFQSDDRYRTESSESLAAPLWRTDLYTSKQILFMLNTFDENFELISSFLIHNKEI